MRVDIFQTWNAIHADPPSREGFTLFPVLLHPRSKGTIRLRSNNPEDPPLINPNYLAEDVDIKILAEGLNNSFYLQSVKGGNKRLPGHLARKNSGVWDFRRLL